MPKQYDVGVDAMGFAPVDLPGILASRRRRAARGPVWGAGPGHRAGTAGTHPAASPL